MTDLAYCEATLAERRPMRTLLVRKFAVVAAALWFVSLCAPGDASAAEKKTSQWRVPIVMEKATVRGKVVVLETRREERASIKNLNVEVWTAPEESSGEESKKDSDAPGRKRLHATKTDELGFFSLPALEEGEYVLVIGELHLGLTVVPAAEVRKGQEEPKVLLLLLPREVLKKT